ncbi:MAG: hypothetical protein RIB93_23330 [Coleofasciculus sp. D1-CHI-01]|uniref:hypothetical protein n=1 Tax=Coleofasciculus sp. D1-CHI-01 TaxID=3068482 RepID=UPI00330165DF
MAMKTYATDKLPVILQNLIADYSNVYRFALIFTVNQRLKGFSNKSKLNTLIQQTFKINKRQAGAVIADADGKIDSAKKCRANHIKQLEGKLKSAKEFPLPQLLSAETFVHLIEELRELILI